MTPEQTDKQTIGRHPHGIICTRDEAIKKGIKPFCQCWDCREREAEEIQQCKHKGDCPNEVYGCEPDCIFFERKGKE